MCVLQAADAADQRGFNQTDQQCAFCYKRQADSSSRFLHCARCGKRMLCSRECQRADWKAGHKIWCGKSGELGHDFTIRESAGKGMGLFALHTFHRNEAVMVERPIARLCYNDTLTDALLQPALAELSESELAAFRRLAPVGGTDVQKRNKNAFALREKVDRGMSAIFINMSRANHDCIGNCSRRYDEEQGLRCMRASRTISAGDEITLSYTPLYSEHTLNFARSIEARQSYLQDNHGFACGCKACTDPDITQKVQQVGELFERVKHLTHVMQLDAALRAGQENVRLLDELQIDDGMVAFAYSDLFQIAILRRKTVADAKRHAAQVATRAAAFYGESDEMAVEHRKYAECPSAYFAYCMADKMQRSGFAR